MCAKYLKDCHVRLNEMQKAHLQRMEEISGIKESSYIRLLIKKDMKQSLVRIISKEEYQQKERLQDEIHRIGVNINQIVHDYHNDFYSPAEKKHLADLLYQIYELLEKQEENDGHP
ncbi:MAG: plasmid mobilization relaxosome protein MobC [Clostridiaceae bacterium]|nr:plasmid mobilization relaxosome protein MobC [Clostridiaceae bacterium]